MNNTIDCALKYKSQFGFSIMPTNQDKKPLIKWEEFQRRIAEVQEINEWWKEWPDANVAIITGKVSGGLGVIDVDDETGKQEINELLPESYLTPISDTPGGGEHIYTILPDGLSLSNNVKIIPGCDFRGEGGYVVAPPSKIAEGSYRWKPGLSLDEVAISETPHAYINRIAEAGKQSFYRNKSNVLRGHDEKMTKMFSDGTRDESLFHVANCLVKGGMPRHEISEVLETLMNSWGESHEEKWREDKIESAFKRADIRDKSLAQEVREWILSSFGVIYSSEFRSFRHLSSVEEQKNLSKILTRLCDEGLIQRYGNKSGCFRIIDATEEEIDFLHCPTDCLDLKWPFEIERYLRIFRKNIVIIAGAPDAGKTAFLLNFVEMNMNSHQIFYFSSEMSGTEFKDRMSNFERKLDSWKVKLIERGCNFQDVIRPDAVNIIDFLEIHDDFYKVGGLIKDIYDRLGKGTAIIALQKNTGAQLGLGGYRSMEKARLYLTVDSHKLRIEKAKNWTNSAFNPNGLELEFKLHRGCVFQVVKDWHKES